MKYSAYILIFLICLIGCREHTTVIVTEEPTFEILPFETEVVAGSTIQIKYRTNAAVPTYLILNNAYGSSLLEPTREENPATFTFPKEFSQRSGVCHWTMVSNGTARGTGRIVIRPNSQKGTLIESYLGPRSISAGKAAYAMFVVSPTDTYDNPLADNTEIALSYQFENTIQTTPVKLHDLIGWKNIHSTEKSGRILVTASCNDAKSKESTALVYPTLPTNFKIDYTRNHRFADGNQIIRFTTDVIKDKFGNVVSDGTLVSFRALNTEGMRLQTTGTTINGVAIADLLHPTKEENWEVTSFITGTAKSNTIIVHFEAAVKNYNTTFSPDGRTIKIDDITSFMGQWVPDGIPITIEIKSSQGISLNIKRATSKSGSAEFILPADYYPKGNYQLQIEIAGIIKTKNVYLQ